MDALTRRRDASPIFSIKEIKSKTDPTKRIRVEEKELLQNGFYNVNVDGKPERRCKINRIPMLSTAEVKVVAVHSPSFIFVRIVNSIRDELVLREPSAVDSLAEWELKEYYYVMCPIEERAYGRARILKIIDDPESITTKLVQLILIDDGPIVWARSSSLVSMDPNRSKGAKDLAYHPWQIQAVSLAGIYPRRTPMNKDRLWKEKVRKRLQSIINGFQKFKVKAVTMSMTNNEYAVATVVSLYGLHVQKEKEGEEGKRSKNDHVMPEEMDIGSTLAGGLPNEVEMARLYDGKKQERFEMKLSRKEEEKLAAESGFIEDFRQQCIKNWSSELKKDEKKVDEWVRSLEEVHIKEMDLEWLKSEEYEYESRIFISLEGAHTISPWEFYGRPIKMVVEEKVEGEEAIEGKDVVDPLDEMDKRAAGDKGDPAINLVKLGEADAMLKGNTILKNHAAVLDVFYSKDINRKQVDKQDIERMLSDGKRAFTICQAGESRAEYTGLWQRVEVLQTNDFSATVRFVDSGGSDMVMYGALFHIHPDHTIWRALCVQLCLHGVRLEGARDGDTWQEGNSAEKRKAIEVFRSLMREDLPMSLSVIPDWQIPRENFILTRGPRKMEDAGIAYERPGVLFLSDMKVQGRTSNIIAEMISSGVATMNPNCPFLTKPLRNSSV